MRKRQILLGLVLVFVGLPAFAQENEFTQWMDSSSLSFMLREMNENRMFPEVVEGRLDGTAIQYRAKFVPYLPKMDYFYSRWGMTDNWYESYTAQMRNEGFTELSHTTFADRYGITLHQATWVLLPQPEPDWRKLAPLIVIIIFLPIQIGFSIYARKKAPRSRILGIFLSVIFCPWGHLYLEGAAIYIATLFIVAGISIGVFHSYLLAVVVSPFLMWHRLSKLSLELPAEPTDDSREERMRKRFESREE
jgi:hypothetical protein